MSVTINSRHIINRVSYFLDSIYKNSPLSPIFKKIEGLINNLFGLEETIRQATSQLRSLSSLPLKEGPIALSLSALSEISPAPTAPPRKHSPTSPEAASNPGKAPTAPPRKRQPQKPPAPIRKRHLLSETPPVKPEIKAPVVEQISDPTPEPTKVFPSEPPKKIGIVLPDGPDDKDPELEKMLERLENSEEIKRGRDAYGEVFTPDRREITIPFFETPLATLRELDLRG